MRSVVRQTFRAALADPYTSNSRKSSGSVRKAGRIENVRPSFVGEPQSAEHRRRSFPQQEEIV